MRKIAVLLVIAGILTALYPLAKRTYFWHEQQRALQSWEEAQQLLEPDIITAEDDPGEAPAPENNTAAPTQRPRPIAVLEVEAIDLKIPVYRGATRANLRIGAGLMPDFAAIGEKGNAVITAHRSHSYGVQFNRLNEVQPGDRVVVATLTERYAYTVYNKEIVEPHQISVLNTGDGEMVVTLITCHPLYSPNPPYRLVVQAK